MSASRITLAIEVFYGLIYVVIEGYRELGFKYEKVDVLLEQSQYVHRLRRFLGTRTASSNALGAFTVLVRLRLPPMELSGSRDSGGRCLPYLARKA